ncbi:ATP-binding cassette domain-containing protein [Sediminibacterium sp.]|jgi:ABC-type bacteriocin/lantibiotic exporter with double-glycine peptidase domain|uniref:peptidase domain-containing ABC transporter n=1 Tax=Sediminibacterium sp. TaxID=1917865 RepID=UPI0025FEAEB3|nr:ATP-binding cassette domain-containing protein [Sediminibacterium sp.]MBW0177036.1 ATP-binding cassette domain-containing protein [Sediminibacterium sp.]
MAQQANGSPSGAARKFFALLKLDRKDVSAIYAFSILAGLVQLSLPLGIQTIISFVMAGSISTSIIVLIVLVVAGVFIYGLLQVRQMQIIEKIKQKIYTRYALEFADRIPKLDIEKLDHYYLPELVNRFFDTISLQKGIEKILLDVPSAIIQIFFGIILLSFYHPVFIGFGALLLLLLYIILRNTLPNGFAASMAASEYKYKTASWLEEISRSIKSFKYSRGTSLNIEKTDLLVSSYLLSRTKYFRILLAQFWSLVTFKVIITATMLIVGVILLTDQQINIGQFIAAEIVILTVMNSVEKLIINLDKVYDSLTSIEKLDKITGSETETGGTELLDKHTGGLSIRFTDLRFSYPDKQYVLDQINCSIAPGEKICVMGTSGSGKSTLLRLLTGAFKNFEGSVLVNNIPIGNYNLNSLRASTGILLSQQDIFQGTLWENITMGNKDITLANITDIIEKCGLSAFLESLPQGLDTQLDPTGKKLPTKTRKGILLARALLGKRQLVLLEEPFNGIENHYKMMVLDFLKKDREATVIITSNDQEVAMRCDKVLYLTQGKATAFGSWETISKQLNA